MPWTNRVNYSWVTSQITVAEKFTLCRSHICIKQLCRGDKVDAFLISFYWPLSHVTRQPKSLVILESNCNSETPLYIEEGCLLKTLLINSCLVSSWSNSEESKIHNCIHSEV
jgi:hypothetical protein